MRAGVFAKTFDGPDAASVLAAARDAGFAAVQFNMACAGLSALPATIPLAAAEGIGAAARASGIEIAAVSATFNMIHPDPRVRAAGLRSLEAIAAACRPMGTGLVTLCTGSRDPVDQWRHHPDNQGAAAWRDLLATTAAALEVAERHGVDLGIEPELANVVDSALAARRFADEMASPRLRIVLDPANLADVATPAARRRLVEQAVDLLGDRIALAHAKDRRADGAVAAAGDGEIDFAHVVATLRKAGFRGAVVAHGLDASDAPRVARLLRSILDMEEA